MVEKSNSRAEKPPYEGYVEASKNDSPRISLQTAVKIVEGRKVALDLGAGALNDSRFLLEQGFGTVVAIDKNPHPIALERVAELSPKGLTFVTSGFEDFDFTSGTYDLVNAQFSLPFTDPKDFARVWSAIKASLKEGGVFVGQLLGDRDEWNGRDDMTFQKKEEALRLLVGLKVVRFVEREYDGTLANGAPKHWHVFYFIAKNSVSSGELSVRT